MTFTIRSSECGLLRVRASSNKWAMWRVLGRKGSWEAAPSGSEYMVISSFGHFSGRLTLWLQPLYKPCQRPCINIITQQAPGNVTSSISAKRLLLEGPCHKFGAVNLIPSMQRNMIQLTLLHSDWLTCYASSCESILRYQSGLERGRGCNQSIAYFSVAVATVDETYISPCFFVCD